MTAITDGLHSAFLSPLGDAVTIHSDLAEKPLCVDVASVRPPKLCVYMYSLVGGIGTARPNEYKAVLRVPGQAVGAYGSFNKLPGRITLLVAYHAELDVFVLWDARMHPRFKNGGNIQVRYGTVQEAAVRGRAEQIRRLSSSKLSELVIACQSAMLLKAIQDRVDIVRSHGLRR